MIQFAQFQGGGFVLHKVPVGQQTYSAWFNHDGSLSGAERTTNHKVSHVPDRQRLVRAELQKVGDRYRALYVGKTEAVRAAAKASGIPYTELSLAK